MKHLTDMTGLSGFLFAFALLACATRPPVCVALHSQSPANDNGAHSAPPPATGTKPQEGEEEESRKLWDEELLQKRSRSSTTARRRYSYRRVTPRLPRAVPTPDGRPGETTKGIGPAPTPAPSSAAPGYQIIGITFWRLRPSRPSDQQESRLLVQDPGGEAPVQYTPERIEAGTPLGKGQAVRISIESPSDGFLYVIDREKYADGSLSEPYLIFPTSRTRGGDNAVRAGAVVEIPAQGEPPFRATPSRPDQVGEALTVIISTQRLGFPLQSSLYKLSAEQQAQLAGWEGRWAAPFERYEQEGGAGTAYTPAEKRAGDTQKQLLTQDDPLPQTIYRVAKKPGAPLMLITVPLNFALTK
jgi:hypothetical protein